MRLVPYFLAALLLGCGQESENRPSPPFTGLTTSSASTASSSGAGGSGEGSGGAGGQGGEADLDAGADAAQTEAGAADPPCTSDLAYWAAGMSFIAPTPQDLGLALSELAYDPTTHPVSLVLAAKGGVGAATLAVSATESNGANPHEFPAGKKPDFVPALLSFGGFSSAAQQMKGYLHFVDLAGPVDIDIVDITVAATTKSNCANILVTLSAFIPPTMASTVLHLKGGDRTIGELGGDGGGGPKDAGPTAWEIRALFPAETISFNFSTLQ
jgi:hypothetical protein